AANALLKTLEEPTSRTYLWLVSHQPGRLLPTIRSRCQTLVLRRPLAEHVAQWLQGGNPDPVVGSDLIAGVTPFTLLERQSNILDNNTLEREIIQVIRNEADPQEIADQWLREGVGPRLERLSALLWSLVRARLAPGLSNGITVSDPHRLHTTAAMLGARGLLH